MATNSERKFKNVKFKIDKVLGQMTWKEFKQLLRDVRYRVFRLANLVVSEAYLGFHLFRTGKADEFKTQKISELSKQLRQMLLDEKKTTEDYQNKIAKTGVLPDTVQGALTQYKTRGLTTATKWAQVIKGETSLPTFKLKMPIPVRCDKPGYRRLEKMPDGSVEIDLMVTLNNPYPRAVLDTKKIDGSTKELLQHLLDEPDKYRQRYFEIKEDTLTGQWWLSVAYEYKPERPTHLKPDIVVGVDIGYSVPLYAAINNGLARLGRREFGAIAHRIKVLRGQVIARRREIQRGGRVSISGDSARSGHGRKRKLLPTEILQKRIDNAQTTANHQMSAAVVDFAIDHGAGVIQMEDVKGLGAEISGTFLGERWRYYQLQQFIKYKAEAKGIKVLPPINPRFTSRRCSECGYINEKFDRAYRNKAAKGGRPAQFICPNCSYEAGPDYNAARNIATIDIGKKIKLQCKKQGLKYEEQ